MKNTEDKQEKGTKTFNGTCEVIDTESRYFLEEFAR